MKKSFFIQLYFVVLFAAVIVPSYIAPQVAQKVVEPFQEQLNLFYVSSSIEALTLSINSSEPSKRQMLVNQLMNDFPYQIELLEFDTQKFNDEEIVLLSRGNIVYNKLSHDLYRLLDDKQSLLVIRNPEHSVSYKLSHAQREVMGTLALLKQSLQGKQIDSWDQIIKRKSEHFSYPLALTTLDNLKLSDSERDILVSGRILTRLSQHQIKYGSGVDYFYQRVPGSNQVISAGPISPFINEQIDLYRYINLWSVAAFIAVVLILWLFPSWRSSHNITITAKRFGEGELASRCEKYAASNLNRMALMFNEMASKIQQLFTGNQTLMLAMTKEVHLPISKIKQSIELLEVNQPVKKQSKSIHSIQASLDELTRLTADILFYAKVQQAPLSLQVENIEICRWLEEQVASAVYELSTFDVELVFDQANSHECPLQFDANNLSRAIRGLLSYLVDKGSRQIIIRCRLLDDCCLIELENTIFKRDENRKSGALTKKQQKIEELPYLIAAHIVEAHQGALELMTADHRPPLISMTLPICSKWEVN